MDDVRHVVAASDHEFDNVREFHEKFRLLVADVPVHLTKRKLMERYECMHEELDEFQAACEAQDLALMADSLIDLVYFAKGTAVMLGLPWRQLWDDVHGANMRKVPGTTHRGHQVDVRKPADWVGPQTNQILLDNGYIREAFCNLLGEIEEVRCVDDLVHLEKDNP